MTLVGAAGVGKTRLAASRRGQVRTQFADGVVFVDLSSTHDAELVPPTMARALAPGEPPSLIEAVDQRALLFVLDNFEQVAAAAPSAGRPAVGACRT